MVVLVLLFGLPWLFNHVNPYLSIVVTIFIGVFVIDLIIKKIKQHL